MGRANERAQAIDEWHRQGQIGLPPWLDDIEDVTLHPDNVAVWSVFEAAATQWMWVSVGMGGVFRSGLNYPAVESVVRGMGLRWRSVFEGLRIAEAAALTAWAEQREADQK